jgi:rhodanese-related sulfurtransferase
VISRAEVRDLVGEHGAQLVEVLPDAEFEAEHLPSALHLPLKHLNAASAAVLDARRAVITYCWDGI